MARLLCYKREMWQSCLSSKSKYIAKNCTILSVFWCNVVGLSFVNYWRKARKGDAQNLRRLECIINLLDVIELFCLVLHNATILNYVKYMFHWLSSDPCCIAVTVNYSICIWVLGIYYLDPWFIKSLFLLASKLFFFNTWSIRNFMLVEFDVKIALQYKNERNFEELTRTKRKAPTLMNLTISK